MSLLNESPAISIVLFVIIFHNFLCQVSIVYVNMFSLSLVINFICDIHCLTVSEIVDGFSDVINAIIDFLLVIRVLVIIFNEVLI